MLGFIYPAALAFAVAAGGFWYWIAVPINLVAVPLADHIVRAAAPAWRPGQRLLSLLFARPLFWLYAAVQAGVLLYVLRVVGERTFSPIEMLGLVSSTGIVTGTVGITAAHELIHRRTRAERGLGLCLLAMTTYMHFRVNHVLGHHRHAGLPTDAGTARLGESFPAFFGRALRDGVVEAWTIETGRLRRANLPPCGSRNRCVQYLVIQLLLYAGIATAFGGWAAAFMLAQSLMAIHLLEGVNYVQHYGLRRAEGPAARAREQDAWDSDYRVSELITFMLPRHSQHHVAAGVDCHALGIGSQSPKLPCSFFLMVFIALLPPLWRRLMDPRARAATAAAVHIDPRPAPAADAIYARIPRSHTPCRMTLRSP